jgi:hypothetical protein
VVEESAVPVLLMLQSCATSRRRAPRLREQVARIDDIGCKPLIFRNEGCTLTEGDTQAEENARLREQVARMGDVMQLSEKLKTGYDKELASLRDGLEQQA